jgi:hypothetical protein
MLDRHKGGYYSHPEDPGEAYYGGSPKRLSVTDEEAEILAKLATGMTVLELGTGLGVSTKALASTAKSVITVDPDPWVREDEVELVCLLDNGSMTLGRKMDELNRLARGDYVVRVEDDDNISADYVDSLLEAIKAHPGVDTIVFRIDVFDAAGRIRSRMHYDIDCQKTKQDGIDWTRPTDGKMCIRRVLWLLVRHPFTSYRGEDWIGPDRLLPFLHTQHKIDRVLYRGYYREDNPERAALVTREGDGPWS